MQTATHHSAEVAQAVTRPAKVAPADFVPLHLETRTHVSTGITARHFSLQEQTLRAQACKETYDKRITPIRVCNRLLWPVAGIKAILGVA